MSDTPGLRHRIDGSGILRIVFDRPGERVNLLNGEILGKIDELLDDARGNRDVKAVLFGSGKPRTFVAGMDVHQIAAVTDAMEAAEGARSGQAVFQKIADLGKPSVCAINGMCLGGGTELALACTFRVASDDVKQIGLPEVRIGIIPGFGGTQRMPRLIGLTPSLDLILTGRNVDAKRALRLGLVDRICPAAYLDREAGRILREALDRGVEALTRRLRKRRPALQRLLENVGPLRRFVLDQARRRTAAKANPEQYPGPFRALDAIDAAFTKPIREGLDLEARIVGELVPTATSKSLIWLFGAQNELKADPGGVRAAPRQIRRMAVMGAGIMGGGIAQLAADRGIPVRMKDIRYDSILTAMRTAHGVWNRKLKKRRITKREMESKLAFIAPTLDETGLGTVDIVLEAVVEQLEVKRKVLADVEQRIGDRTVFATNTSSIPIGDIAARATRPERVVGMHFFNPVHRMPLIEVIAGERSSAEAVATVHALAVRLGKVPVVVKDGPGFLVNRILTLYLNEAMQLLSEGVRIEAADQAMLSFGMPMGPFALLDQVGLDTAHHVGQVLQDAFGERIGGSGEVLQILVDAGRLGKKNGKGFYRYRDGKRTTPDSGIYRTIGDPPSRELPPETLQERMVLAMMNEAAVCLQEDVVALPRDIDIGMVMGTGFPPFRGGLLHYADSLGIAIVADRLSRLADAHGKRFGPASLWSTMIREQRKFYET